MLADLGQNSLKGIVFLAGTGSMPAPQGEAGFELAG
jgi:hypothetical protein